jgi:hypothetical protein
MKLKEHSSVTQRTLYFFTNDTHAGASDPQIVIFDSMHGSNNLDVCLGFS